MHTILTHVLKNRSMGTKLIGKLQSHHLTSYDFIYMYTYIHAYVQIDAFLSVYCIFIYLSIYPSIYLHRNTLAYPHEFLEITMPAYIHTHIYLIQTYNHICVFTDIHITYTHDFSISTFLYFLNFCISANWKIWKFQKYRNQEK